MREAGGDAALQMDMIEISVGAGYIELELKGLRHIPFLLTIYYE